jgi:2-polyprenyl-6-methoxyphenol hydroxylase-like FAD-dependent oxidoreductase
MRPEAGEPRKPRVPISAACVLGGSFAGLLAARVLADHAVRVTVLERDVSLDEPVVRPSVPHGRHGHFVQPEGLALIEGWFPGFTQDARARGAVLAPPGPQRLFIDGEAAEYPDVALLIASRPLLESEIRRWVRAMPNVRVLRAQATGLRHDGGTVHGATYREHDADAWSAERALDADLIVDAMGRGSRLRSWLAGYGYTTPAVERVPVGSSYATALFSRPRDPREPGIPVALNLFTSPPPADHRPHAASARRLSGIAVYAIEGSRWQVSAMTYATDQVETTAADLRGLCADLPEVFREATSGDPVGEVATFYYRDSLRRPVTDLERFPAGLVSVGDSVASFNPVHAQGISSAAGQVAILAEHLAASDDPAAQSRDFIQRREKSVDTTWKAAAGA